MTVDLPTTRLHALQLLSRVSFPSTSLKNRLKFLFRPAILPIGELLSLLPSGCSVFDIGCGQGQLLTLISQLKRPTKIAGVEIDSELVSNANYVLTSLFSQIPNPVEVFDGVHLPACARQFNHWLLVDVLHHIPPVKRLVFFTSLRKNMGKNTVLIVKDIAAQKRVLTGLNKLHDWLFSGSPGYEVTTAQFTHLMSESKFTVKKIIYSRVLWYPHFIALCYPL